MPRLRGRLWRPSREAQPSSSQTQARPPPLSLLPPPFFLVSRFEASFRLPSPPHLPSRHTRAMPSPIPSRPGFRSVPRYLVRPPGLGCILALFLVHHPLEESLEIEVGRVQVLGGCRNLSVTLAPTGRRENEREREGGRAKLTPRRGGRAGGGRLLRLGVGLLGLVY